MNEIRLIRDQLALERLHALEVANACARACEPSPESKPVGADVLEAFRGACGDYLRFVLGGFERRDRRLAGLPGGLAPGHDGPGGSQAALETLASTGAAPEAWRRLADYLDSDWESRGKALEARLTARASISDWRTFSGVDADSILAERELFQRFRAAMPDGIHSGTSR